MNFQQEALISIWKKEIETHLGKSVAMQQIGIVGGGSISQAYKVHTDAGAFFVKTNQLKDFPGMFELESKGLHFLRDKSQFDIPQPIAHGELDDGQWILMSFVQAKAKSPNFWTQFGKRLANLHQNTQDVFGLSYHNYFGSLKQSNTEKSNWAEFFIENRLEPQLKLAVDSKKVRPETATRCQRLFLKLDEMLPKETPAALHGDLWSGNFMADQNGGATVFDPAVFYGHREVDIAMTRLFGTFSEDFYNSYNSHFPLESGWEDRVDIFNLYPLLAHVNLFGGGGYQSQVTTILRRLA